MGEEQKKIKVLFLVRRVGPYHHARFQKASELVDLTAIETRSSSMEYNWDFKANGSYTIDRLPIAPNPEAGLHGQELRAAMIKVFERHPADVVVTTGWADQEYHSAIIETDRRQLPRIVISDSRYRDEPRKVHKEIIKKLILKSYSAAIVAGTESREYLLQLNFQKEAIFHPWDVVDNDHFRSEGNTPQGLRSPFSDRYFLCVSRFVEKKNLDRLLRSYARYLEHNGRRKLVLLGSGHLESQLRQLSEDLSLGGSLEMPGFAQYETLKRYYNNAFALILPSTTDQWGLVVNEAMAAGLPVAVSSNCGCAKDIVAESENGFIFDPYDIEEMASILIKMDERSEMDWTGMSNKSISMIGKWGLLQFACALQTAAQYAIAQPRRSITPLIHKILAR